MGAYKQILVANEAGVSTITLNRPDRLNAWTGQMGVELQAAITEAGRDREVRCIVITGAGRGFCAGADMENLQGVATAGAITQTSEDTATNFDDAPGPDLGTTYGGYFGYWYSCPKPIIAAINGPCAGIGLVLTLYADLRFATASAKFTTAFAARGLIAEHGAAWLLPRLIGEANTLDLLFTARKFTGTEAAELGLVNKALPDDSFMQHVNDVAQTLANDVSPRSLAIMKRQVRAAYGQSFNESLAIANREMNGSFATADFKEGIQSYVEKRAPKFEGI